MKKCMTFLFFACGLLSLYAYGEQNDAQWVQIEEQYQEFDNDGLLPDELVVQVGAQISKQDFVEQLYKVLDVVEPQIFESNEAKKAYVETTMQVVLALLRNLEAVKAVTEETEPQYQSSESDGVFSQELALRVGVQVSRKELVHQLRRLLDIIKDEVFVSDNAKELYLEKTMEVIIEIFQNISIEK